MITRLLLIILLPMTCFGQAQPSLLALPRPATAGYDIPNSSLFAIILDAEDLSTGDGNPVADWDDRATSIGGNEAVHASGSGRPTMRTTGGPNSKKTVEFDGSANIMQGTTAAAYGQSNTVIMVCQLMTGNYPFFFDSTNSSAREAIYLNGGTVTLFQYATGNGNFFNWITNDWTILTATFAGASSYIRTNGVTAASGSDPGSTGMDGLTIGAIYNAAFFANTKICWIGVTQTGLTTNEYYAVESALASRYAITIP